MKDNFTIEKYFPIPFYIGNIPPNLSSIVSYLDTQQMREQDPTISDNYGLRSLNSYILNEPPCLDLSNYILTQATNYGNYCLNYSYKDYKFSQSWITQKLPGQSHLPHIHTNSLISGVFYYGNIDSSTPQIEIHNPNIKMFSNTGPKTNPKRSNVFVTPHISIKPIPGMLILFPSTLIHSVPLNTTNKARKSLAFNIVPTEGFGNEGELTELKFN